MSFHDPQFAKLLRDNNIKDRSVDDLVKSYTPLVRKVAWQIYNRSSKSIELEDFLQIGMLALTEAAMGYEDRGFGFANYAKLRVRGAMIDQLRKSSNLSRASMKFQKKLTAAQDKLFQETGNNPDEQTLAEALNMKHDEFLSARDQSVNIDLKSLDEVYSDQNSHFEDQTECQDEVLEQKQLRRTLAGAIKTLPPRHGLVIQLYFIDQKNLEDIGKELNLGAARICQIKKAALEQLHDHLKPLRS